MFITLSVVWIGVTACIICIIVVSVVLIIVGTNVVLSVGCTVFTFVDWNIVVICGVGVLISLVVETFVVLWVVGSVDTSFVNTVVVIWSSVVVLSDWIDEVVASAPTKISRSQNYYFENIDIMNFTNNVAADIFFLNIYNGIYSWQFGFNFNQMIKLNGMVFWTTTTFGYKKNKSIH